MHCYSSSAICLNQPADSQSHQQCEAKRSGKSVRSLAKSLRSLLGLKAHLTPSWLESVCRIVQDLPSTKPVDASKMETPMCEVMEAINHSNTEVDASASKIRGDLALLNDCLIQLNMQRRQALNDLLDLKGNIRVFCRVRPFLQNEAHGHMRSAISSNSSNVFLKFANTKSKQYSFDKVFHPGSTQEEVFAEIDPVIKSALDGYNVCIFAYGQTGTGKTFTMEGRPGCPGIVPCGIEALFQQALESNYKYLFTFSMLEIYMGSIRDLLIPQRKKGRVHKAPRLSIRMDPNGGIEIENLVAIQVNDFEQVQSLYKLGKQLRSTASTNSNSKSSRSHCLIRITLTCSNAHERQRETNKIWMVDLGGSERLLKTQASGRRLEEGKAINLSLSALGDVISALQSKRSHVPYRNSKLTQVLRDSLESDSKTLMIVHISPNEEDLCETICSLGFATRARSIHLGDEESEEARSKKELAMGELLQLVKHFESECRYVKQDIKRLNEQLKLVERTDLQSGHTESSYPSTAGPQSHHGNHKVNVKDFSAVSANLPRFMRPTICSQRKTIIDHHPQTSMKKPPLPSKRKSSSVYAESVTSVAKDLLRQSDNGSDCSTFICSYMNWNYSADDGTDCSQSASEYEIKKVIFPEKENSPRSFGISPSIESINKSDDCRVAESNEKMRFTVDDWLHSQVKEWSTTYFQGNKRVIAIQVDGIANGLHEKDLGNTTIEEEMLTCDSTKISSTIDKKVERKDLNNYETVKQFGEVVLNEKSLKDTILDETRVLSVGSLSDITDGKYAQSRIFDEMLMSKLIPKHHLEEFSEITKDSEPGYDLYAELMETPAQKDCKLSSRSYSEDFHQSKQYIEDADEPRLHLMKAQRSLYMAKGPPALDGKNVAPEENMAPATNILEEKHGQGTNGMFRQTFQMLWACVLLGFGVQSFGFGHDFYDGLLL